MAGSYLTKLWRAAPTLNTWWAVYIDGVERVEVGDHVTIYNNPDEPSEVKAIAYLIAASPCLLAALVRLETAASNRENTMGSPCNLIAVQAELRAATEQARAAIAKARNTQEA
jgi:hypothetical protein